MEVKLVSSVSRINRNVKNNCHKIQKSSFKKRVHHTTDESIYRISKVMSELVPKSRHFADDVNLLEFTIEYLKQTSDFQRGVGSCAEETKIFLKQHIFDRNKIISLFKKIQQRIDYISKPDHIQTLSNQVENSFLIGGVDHSHGVLLDLSMKQNRLTTDEVINYNTIAIRSLCNNIKKREILDKIRKKILDKRRLSNLNNKKELIRDDEMWRPWRF